MTEEEKKADAAQKMQQDAETAAKRLREELDSPIDFREAEVYLAESSVQRCQLRAYVNDLEAQIHELKGKIGAANAQMIALDVGDAVVRRRMCNNAKRAIDA